MAGLATSAFGENRTFMREYTYSAGEDDSRNSSRSKAIEQVKVLLLEEIGLYVESWVQLDQVETNEQMSEFFQQEIRQVTAGITETVIADESWDGYSYKITAQITVDTDDVLRRINEALEARASNEEVERLRQLLTASEAETSASLEAVADLQAQLTNMASSKEDAERELARLQQQLADAKGRLKEIQTEEKQIRSDYERITAAIGSATSAALDKIRLGMTKEEVVRVAGPHRLYDECGSNEWLSYGQVWVGVESGAVQCIVGTDQYRGRCSDCKSHRNLSVQNLLKR